jgi:hypothetical protein
MSLKCIAISRLLSNDMETTTNKMVKSLKHKTQNALKNH